MFDDFDENAGCLRGLALIIIIIVLLAGGGNVQVTRKERL